MCVDSSKNVLREKISASDELPVLCTGCKGFFRKRYKTRHQKICTSTEGTMMMPMISSKKPTSYAEGLSDGFKTLLNSMRQEVSETVKTDEILLMIGNRYYNSLKRKQDKKIETTKYVRSRLRLTARVYMAYKTKYKNQYNIVLENWQENSSDMFRRETKTILGK